MSRRPLVAGNWKMFKTRAEARAFAETLAVNLAQADGVELAICPPFTSIDVVAMILQGTGVGVFRQTGHESENGAHTGEVSMGMLADAGASGVLLGHSERRADCAETDQALARKVPAALAAGLTPVLCVGESEFERDSGSTKAILDVQVREGLSGVPKDRLGDVVVAYEPIWAIGTGKIATAQEISQMANFIKEFVSKNFSNIAEFYLLYGGSVSSKNSAEILQIANIDGLLVGGASLDANEFIAIANS